MLPRANRELTPTEYEVLKLLACGMTYDQMAEKRGRSERTIRTCVGNILLKLGTPTRLQAALYAWRNGVISIDDAWDTLQAHSEAV